MLLKYSVMIRSIILRENGKTIVNFITLVFSPEKVTPRPPQKWSPISHRRRLYYSSEGTIRP